MNRKFIYIPLIVLALTGCAKTNSLYNQMDYNYVDIHYFDNNYYTDWSGIDKLEINNEIHPYLFNVNSEDGINSIPTKYTENLEWNYVQQESAFGYQNSLSSIDDSFKNTGILSKLFDGRVRCDGYLTKARVQLDKTGFAMYFPKILTEVDYFAFACRGGSNLETSHYFGSKEPALKFNFEVTFYIHIENSSKYDKVTYNLENIDVQTDNGGGTNLISFPVISSNLIGAVGMSITWDSNDSRLETYNLSTNYLDKEKNHLSLMLYEVFLLGSSWY